MIYFYLKNSSNKETIKWNKILITFLDKNINILVKRGLKISINIIEENDKKKIMNIKKMGIKMLPAMKMENIIEGVPKIINHIKKIVQKKDNKLKIQDIEKNNENLDEYMKNLIFDGAKIEGKKLKFNDDEEEDNMDAQLQKQMTKAVEQRKKKDPNFGKTDGSYVNKESSGFGSIINNLNQDEQSILRRTNNLEEDTNIDDMDNINDILDTGDGDDELLANMYNNMGLNI